MSDFTRSSRVSPGPRDWILDIFGSFIRDAGGWIAVSDLLDLLISLDVATPSARSALSRMKARDELTASERDGQRGYELTDAAELWFRDGTGRIMEPSPAAIDNWIMVSFTVPESARMARYQLRSRLQELGFGQVGRGLMIAPGHLVEETQHALANEDYRDCLMIWRANPVSAGDMAKLVAEAWDLDEILSRYNQYLEFVEELDCLADPKDDVEAFVRYLHNVNAWRDLPFRDPGIPLDYLPVGWPSVRARAQFMKLANDLRPAALRHFEQVVL